MSDILKTKEFQDIVNRSTLHSAMANKIEELASKIQELEAKLRSALIHLKFTTHAAENLFQSDKPLSPNLMPDFYHTLTYEGDSDLIAKTKAARDFLKENLEEK